MMNKLFTKIAAKIFMAFRSAYDRQYKLHVENVRKTICVTGEHTVIDDDANIQNATGDPARISIGDHSWVRGYLLVFNHGGKIEIGEYSFIGPDTRIWSAKKITIGNRVLIAHNVNIHDNISHPLDAGLRHEDYKHILNKGLQTQNDLREEAVFIGDDAWIGFNAIITKGVRIGKGAIVGAGTIVTEDVPDYAVVIGNPARIIKYVDSNGE